MHLSQVDCSGSEFRIFDCSYKTDAANECGSNQNSGVFCNSGTQCMAYVRGEFVILHCYNIHEGVLTIIRVGVL